MHSPTSVNTSFVLNNQGQDTICSHLFKPFCFTRSDNFCLEIKNQIEFIKILTCCISLYKAR